MISNPIDGGKRWQDLCRKIGQFRTENSGRGAVYPQLIADQSVVSTHILGLIKRFVCSGNRGVNILFHQRRNTDADRHIGCYLSLIHI